MSLPREMSLGPLMTDIAGTSLTPDEREMLLHPDVGGVILFSRNYESPGQLAALTSEIHALRQPRLLIAVDQEGGRVQRFHEGFTPLPPAARYGELYESNRREAQSVATEIGWLMAAELIATGVDISFAPVLDLGRGISTVIGDRALHADPQVIAELAHAWMRGMNEAGMAATGKHFPGHGSVRPDSHQELPQDHRPAADILTDDMLPFERMIHYGLPAVMMSHVVYSQCDAMPAGFSSYWIARVLRGELGFQGAVFSDDLSMKATEVFGGYLQRARMALAAGCDMVLVCNNPQARDDLLGKLRDFDNPVSHLRLVRMHGKPGPDLAGLRKTRRWQRARDILRDIDPEPSLDLE